MSSAGPVEAPVLGAPRPQPAGVLAVGGAAVVALLVAAITAAALTDGSVRATVRTVALVLLVLSASAVLGAAPAAARLPLADPVRGRLLDAAAIAAGMQTVLAATTAFLLYLGTAPAPDDPSFGPGLVAFVAEVPVGRTWAVAAGAAAVLTALLVAVRSRAGVVALWPLAGVALVPVAVQGALVGTAIGTTRSAAAALLVVLVGVGTWTGTAALQTMRVIPRSRSVALTSLCAVAVALAAGWPALRAAGLLVPVGVVGAVLLLVAGVTALRGLPAVQTVLLAAATGLGAVAEIVRALPDVPARTTPAELLTGAALPARPDVAALVTAWRPDPLWLVVVAALLVGAVVTVQRARLSWPPARIASWTTGAVLLAWLTSGGPAVYQEVLFGARLGQQLAMLLLVPVLLVEGAPRRAHGRPRLRIPAVRPAVAAASAAALVLLLLAGPVLRWSITDPVGTETVLAALLLVGLLLAGSIAAADDRRAEAVASTAVLLGLEVLGAVLLATGSSLVLADWYGAMGWGTDALDAQRSAVITAAPVAVLPTVALLVRALRLPSAAPAAAPRPAVTA